MPSERQTRLQDQRLSKEHELARFTRYLKLLHRLGTTTHATIDDLFADYLRTGCEIFGAPSGALLGWENGSIRVRKVHGYYHPEITEELTRRILSTGETYICCGEPDVSAFCIGTPIVVDEKAYGTIVFWSNHVAESVDTNSHTREVIELLAKSIGAAIRQRQLTDQLAHQAMHDALTGLANRLLMKERLNAALEEAAQQGIQAAVAFIDLDRFKEINDTLGHGIGDGVLQQVARRLEQCLEPSDSLARMGGDEFTAILMCFKDRHEAMQRVRKLLTAVREPFRVEEYELFVTGSIGVSFYPHDGGDATTLLRNADSAMYIAKARGKNDIHCFDAEMLTTALERLDLETRLRRALERCEFEMLFQPQVDPRGQLAAVEVLLSWDHPDLGRVPPARFIPIAEETGMIVAIGSWVLHQACVRMASWIREGREPFSISVNVSALQFAQPGFVGTVAGALAGTGLPPRYLELEVTESLIMRDLEQSASVMRDLRELGVRIAIDDFGTGYSSLSYLRRLPADTLKIDQSFLQGIEAKPAAALVQTIVTLGHAMELQVAAEGVETHEQFEILRKAGCERMQGHLIGAPMPEARLGDVLKPGWRWNASPES